MQDPGGLGIFLVMARALAPAPFQPDFRARWDRRDTVAPRSSSAQSQGRANEPAAAPTKPAPRKIRFLERLDRWFWAQQQRDLEAYLARSADIHDLEQRMRNLERGAWHRYN
jgi:hypothetical protein